MNRAIPLSVAGHYAGHLNQTNGRPELISAQAIELLNLRRLPAMLNIQQTAVILGTGEHDVSALIRAGLLKSLGDPPVNAVKYFAAVEILELANDPTKLGKIRSVLYRYWQTKNARKARSSNVRQG